jgi:hypothetical protein
MSAENKNTDLLQLLRFVDQENAVGWCANIWFNGLINKYPFHFLLYAQNTNRNEYRKEKAKEYIKQKINHKMDKILSTLIDQKDIIAYEKLLSTLDDIILKNENQQH